MPSRSNASASPSTSSVVSTTAISDSYNTTNNNVQNISDSYKTNLSGNGNVLIGSAGMPDIGLGGTSGSLLTSPFAVGLILVGGAWLILRKH